MEKKRYATAAGMRMALEARLKKIAGETSVAPNRLRRHMSFD